MGILLHNQTRVVVQGMTGKEGMRATESMIASGTHIVCGVTPGKGGQTVHNLPVFDSVAAALKHDPAINTSVLYVPPLMVLDAVREAMHAGITLIIIITENVPVADSAQIIELAKQFSCRVIGPSSVGILDTAYGAIGSIQQPQGRTVFTPGHVGIISKSGGMCAETALLLTQAGLGQTTVIGIGGDVIAATAFTDLLELFEQDNQTKAVVLFGEIGGGYEERVAKMVADKKFTKPVVAFISGRFAETLGRSLALGHAGAIIQDGSDTAQTKKQVLRDAGILVADYHYELPELVKKVL